MTAIIVAAGSGSRFDSALPKQFYELDGAPLLIHALKKFDNCLPINDIILVVGNNQLDYCQRLIDSYKIKKIKSLVIGGENRQQSVYNGLNDIKWDCEIVLIHDAARPFITDENITSVIDETIESNACTLGVKSKDTVKECNSENIVISTLNREALWLIQTPQGFKYDLILAAHKNAQKNNITATDDASLVEQLGKNVKVVAGSYKNIKITTKEDLAW